jgi:hypothetical protein
LSDGAFKRETSDSGQRTTRTASYPIVVIALFQFLKAGFLFYMFLQFWHGFAGWVASGRPGESLFLRSFLDRPFVILFPVLSVAFVVIGWGLLTLRNWARGVLLATIVGTWVGGRYGGHLSLDALIFGDNVDLRHAHFGTLICLFFLDLFVFCCLAFYPDIAKTFGQRPEKTEIIP